ncbi:8-oxo-dGTP diphosphatase [Paenibacillus alkaliterrae]|uniref:8-oxo-dGTP diphosphatase n=1 Tax=Paenibacillus alkaliterrae TaxID=320909 RepID=UPI001F1E0EE4|nr:8-oxo-dGTP diphosphatase [Paenibacillus alkaliterrae]MCF2937160.1 8-oxo-dGTP diphosphatase [Paenibacillus alkaliterrae]
MLRYNICFIKRGEEILLLNRERAKGIVTWTSDGSQFGGMYAYLAEVPEELAYPTPIKTDEGILDWKTLAWIMHEHNEGIASNLPKALAIILRETNCYDHHCVFINGRLAKQHAIRIHSELELDAAVRDQYLHSYSVVQ